MAAANTDYYDSDKDGLNDRFESQSFLREKITQSRIAYAAMVTFIGVLICIVLFISPDRLEAIESIIETALFFLASIIGGYMGITNWASVKKGDKD